MVHVKGTGVGGKNMEAALAAAVHMQELFREKEMSVSETRMCFLCCDSDGHDGVTKVRKACFWNKIISDFPFALHTSYS